MRYETSKHQPRAIKIMMTSLVLIGLACLAIAFLVKEFHSSRLGLALFSLFWFSLFAIMYLSSYAWYTRYETKEDGLFCRGSFKKGLLPYSEISSCRVLSSQGFNEFMNRKAAGIAYSEAGSDLSGWAKASKKYGKSVQFATVQSAHSTISKGNFRNIVSVTSQTEGEAVLLTMKDGSEYLLTPVNPDALAQDVNVRINRPE